MWQLRDALGLPRDPPELLSSLNMIESTLASADFSTAHDMLTMMVTLSKVRVPRRKPQVCAFSLVVWRHETPLSIALRGLHTLPYSDMGLGSGSHKGPVAS